MTNTDLLFELSDGIGLITLNRPEARNALTFSMYERLAEICVGIEPAGEVKALIMTGSGGKAFAAGTDISLFRDFKTAEQALAYERRMDEVLTAIETCPVPTIAAIAGACTGGGAAIAASCDLRIGARDLKFGFPIARTLGNCLSNASLSRMVALIGPGRTKEMIFTARLIEAEEALRLGLVSELHADHAAVLGRALELARTLLSHAPLTLRATKIALRRMRLAMSGGSDEDLITMCYTSEDFREGLDAFLAKRPPRWKGK
ncbi:MAG TPA: enoyl-CoA hydratase/isomerase family protein [Hyphomicrobiaceae bacterium]|nr:enoyl-CoA hydratase/isomerase family protein [Hyphomicrobiaceae bacterium]